MLEFLKGIATASFETSRTTHPITQHHIPEDSKPHPHCCGNRKSRYSLSNFVTNASYFRKSIAVLKVPRLRLLVLPITVIMRWRRIWSIGGMIMTEENRSIGRKTSTSVISYTTNPTLTGSGSKRPSYDTTACSLIFALTIIIIIIIIIIILKDLWQTFISIIITIIIIIINRLALFMKVIAVCSIFIRCGRNTKSV